MSLIVKIMSAEDTADSDTRKGFLLHSGVRFANFERIGTGADEVDRQRPWLTLHFVDPTAESLSFEPRGNVYVMNEAGKTVASYGVAPIIYADETASPPADAAQVSADAMKAAVGRFLSWQLPKSFNPDGGITFDAARVHPNHWPTGTNLLDYTQAEAMLRHVLGD